MDRTEAAARAIFELHDEVSGETWEVAPERWKESAREKARAALAAADQAAPQVDATDRIEAAIPNDLRAQGWAIAIHNDYWQNGERKTFWLMTHRNGRWLKGEGSTDAMALNEIRAGRAAIRAMPLPAPPQPAPQGWQPCDGSDEPGTPIACPCCRAAAAEIARLTAERDSLREVRDYVLAQEDNENADLDDIIAFAKREAAPPTPA